MTNRIKNHAFLIFSGLFLFAIQVSAQKEIRARLLFFQNDLFSEKNLVGQAFQGYHAGEWQNGLSFRRIYNPYFAHRMELNFTRGRYALAGQGPDFWQEGPRFSYLSFHLLPEWRINSVVSLGQGAFMSVQTQNPYDVEDPVGGGLMTNLGLQFGSFEINGRFQRFFGSGKFTLGAGLDYVWKWKKKSPPKL